MKKRAKVHLLPTNDAEFNYAPIFKDVDGKTLVYNKKISNPDVFWKDCQYFHIYITTDDSIKIGDWYTDGVVVNQLQYDELPMSYDRKIIATTDPELYYTQQNGHLGQAIIQVSQLSKAFIEEYCRAGGIDEVDVEYERDFSDFLHWASNQGYSYDKHFGWEHSNGRRPNQSQLEKEFESVPKINSNNEIIIHLIGDKVYSKDEVYKLAKVAYRMGAQNHNDATVERFDEWIKTFL